MKEKCFYCGEEVEKAKMCEVDRDVEINGNWKIKTELVCEECYFKYYV